MEKKLSGKVALVTGASKGIGAEIARALAEAGASVAVNYATDHAAAGRLVDEITARGGKAIAIQADVATGAGVEHLFQELGREFGPTDILVNNAGIYRFGPLESVTEEEFHQQFNTNVLSVFLVSQAAVKQFPMSGGSIVNIATAGVELNSPMTSLYTATKSAVVAMTRVLAKELGARNIRVNAIAPGATETEGLQALGFLGSGMDIQTIAATPLQRLGRPSDIAPVAVFLAGADAGWVTGETICVSGGLR